MDVTCENPRTGPHKNPSNTTSLGGLLMDYPSRKKEKQEQCICMTCSISIMNPKPPE